MRKMQMNNKKLAIVVLIVFVLSIFSVNDLVSAEVVKSAKDTKITYDVTMQKDNENKQENFGQNDITTEPSPTPGPIQFELSKDQTYLVKYKEKTDKKKLKEKITKMGGKVKKDIEAFSIMSIELSDEAVPSLFSNQEICYIEPNYTLEYQSESIPWGIEDTHATEVQSQGSFGKGIKIAVFDTGISDHNDLNIKGGASFVDESTYNDDNGHGTHVAGIIASLVNKDGIVGVAPESEIYSVKVLNSNGIGNYSTIIEAIDWCIKKKINIINMSLGGKEYSQMLEEAINKAYENNILIIAAAGNNGITYPAKYDNVIAVGAIDQNEELASFSAIDSDIELVAPGVDIYSTLNNEDYGFKSGTSMAAPHVAGVAALIWCSDSSLMNTDVRNVLDQSAKYLGDYESYGYGLVDAANALNNMNEILNDNVEEDKSDNSNENKNENNKKDKEQEDLVVEPQATPMPSPSTEKNNNGEAMIMSLPATPSTPSLTVNNRTNNSITFDVVYPTSGNWGNRLELYNFTTNEWRDVSETYYTTDGSYVSNNLDQGTSYLGRLTWYSDDNWHVLDCYVTTLGDIPSITASNATSTSITWQVIYPGSGAWGNRLELYNTSSYVWSDISGTYNTNNGSYTSNNLNPGTLYKGRLTWYSDGKWNVLDCYVIAQTDSTSIIANNITSTSISWQVKYPTSGIYGNRLLLYNFTTQQWTDISGTYYTTNGSYTTNNLVKGTTYVARLKTYSNGIWRNLDCYITTPGDTPSITASNVTSTSITWQVKYPGSGAWGDRLELYNRSTGEWIDISGTYYTNNGSYTTSNLSPGTSYFGRLTWYSERRWYVLDCNITTIGDIPSITISNVASSSITWQVAYPASGAWGNRLELYNTLTKEWNDISGTYYTNNGSYTSANLDPGTKYMGRLTFYCNGTWEVIDCNICTEIQYKTLAFYGIDISDFESTTFIINYDPNELEVTDLCKFTSKIDLTVGAIPGTDIQIINFVPGEIEFTVNKALSEGEKWSGIVDSIQFEAKIDGTPTIQYDVR